MNARLTACALLGAALAASAAFAQKRIEASASGVSAIATEGNTASVSVGSIGAGAQVEGVSVINGRVYIDGKEIPPHVKRHESRGGTVYRIERRNGSVDVRTEETKPR